MRRLLPFFLLWFLLPALARADTLTVFAAASLTDAFGDASAAWAAHGHEPLRLSFGASSTLARQIEQGAAVNLFASADERWMDYLAQRGLVAPDTRRNLLTNKLVLIVPKTHPAQVTIGPGFDLLKLLGPNGRLATGDPAHVPVGIYAEQALRHLGLWSSIEGRLARTDSVRSALLLVERGEAPAGIVYSTDALASSGVVVAGTFPRDTHDPIVYPFALIRGHDSPEAHALLDFLSGTEARDIFARRGFGTE
ncbi:MAG: molybdate ABC transporter substrate-binding protein [Acetobacteraceae bacterium]|nr:molybdate ABC transporter substrate-binding protein [Acetobacteraceae bacterium]